MFVVTPLHENANVSSMCGFQMSIYRFSGVERVDELMRVGHPILALLVLVLASVSRSGNLPFLNIYVTAAASDGSAGATIRSAQS